MQKTASGVFSVSHRGQKTVGSILPHAMQCIASRGLSLLQAGQTEEVAGGEDCGFSTIGEADILVVGPAADVVLSLFLLSTRSLL